MLVLTKEYKHIRLDIMHTSYTGLGQSVVVIDTGQGAHYNSHNVIYDLDFADHDSDGRDPMIFSHGAMVGDVVSDNAPGAGIIHLKVVSDFARSPPNGRYRSRLGLGD